MTPHLRSQSKNGSAEHQPADVIRAVVIDDHPAIHEALADAMRADAGIVFLGACFSASEALSLIESLQPDVAVVDISLNEGHGIDLVTQIRALYPKVQIVVFTMYDESAYAERAIRAGAMGYVTKSAPTRNILEAIRHAATGQIYLSHRMASLIVTRMVKGELSEESSLRIEALTDRELAVFQMLGEGSTIHEIAERLGLVRKTIEAYRRRAKEKLEIDTIPELLHQAAVWTSGHIQK